MDPLFEKYFATPQVVDIAALCGAYDVEHQVIHDWNGFLVSVTQLPETGLRVLELRTERKADREKLREILRT
jgi:2-succinyl-5-enolpyruvyl-6-hydroxy-3-cyclohexene-1-carboxylate synthase